MTDKVEELFYPVKTALEPIFQAEAAVEVDTLGLSSAQRAQRHADFTAMIRETGVEAQTVGKRLYELQTHADVAAAQGAEDADVQAAQGQREEMRRVLRETYGPKGTDDLIARTQKFVRAHPRLHQILELRDIGSDTALGLALVEHVRRSNFR